MSDIVFEMQESIKSLRDFLLKSSHYGIFPLKLLKISLTVISNHQNIRQTSINGIVPVAYHYCKYQPRQHVAIGQYVGFPFYVSQYWVGSFGHL